MADGPQPARLQRTAGRGLRGPRHAPQRFRAAPADRHHDRRRPLHADHGHPPRRGTVAAAPVGTVRPGRGGLLRRRQRLHGKTPAAPAGGVPAAALRTPCVGAGGLPHPGQGVLPLPVVRAHDAAHLPGTPWPPGKRTRQAPFPDPALPVLGRHRHPRSKRPRRRPAALRERQLRRRPLDPQGPGQQRLGRGRKTFGRGPSDPVQRHAPPHDPARHLVSEPPSDRRRFGRHAGLRGRRRVASGLTPRLRRTQPAHGLGLRRRPVRRRRPLPGTDSSRKAGSLPNTRRLGRVRVPARDHRRPRPPPAGDRGPQYPPRPGAVGHPGADAARFGPPGP